MNNAFNKVVNGIKKMGKALAVAVLAAIKLFLPVFLLIGLVFLVVFVVVSVVDQSGINESFFNFSMTSSGDKDVNSPKIKNATTTEDKESAVEDETIAEIPTRDVTVHPESQNAGIKAFYHVMAERSSWQIDEEGNLINATSDEAKKDYLNRDEGFYINPMLLYALNEACYKKQGIIYPEQFIKPVAYTYENGKFELVDLVDDKDNVTVSSALINEKNGKPTGKTDKFVGDYGFGTVTHYTKGQITKTLKGSYISYEEFDATACQVVTKNYETPEAFSIDMGSDECDIIDGVVTFLGAKNYETTFEEGLDAACSNGESAKESDNVKRVLYSTVNVDLYTATKGEGENLQTVADKTKEWCTANGFTPVEDSKHVKTINLYKNRSNDSGLYSNAPKPEDGDEQLKGSLEYFNDYLIHYMGYIPLNEGRTAMLFDSLTTIADVEDVKNGGTSSGGSSGKGGASDSQKGYVDKFREAALMVQKESGISAAFLIAQSALESGWGDSDLAKKYNNYFGIKWTEGCGYDYVEMMTNEGSGASRVRIKAKFRRYKDIKECLDDWCRIMWNAKKDANTYRYRDVAGKSYEESIKIIHDGGYFTDSVETYLKGVKDIVSRNNLEKLEKDPKYQWDGKPPVYADKDSKKGKKGSKSITSSDYAGNLSEEDAETIDTILNMYLSDKDIISTDYYETTYRQVQIHPTRNDRLRTLYTAVAFSNHLYISEVEKFSEDQIMQVLLANTSSDDNKSEDGSGGNNSGLYVGDGDYLWPVPKCTTITSPFGKRNSPTAGASSFHRGIDIGCASGSDVVAAADGTVEVSEQTSTEGMWIQINHGNGVKTVYMHNSKLLVKKGDKVKKGQVIAKSGSTGISTGPHLHFGVNVNGEYKNPLDYVNPQSKLTKKVSKNSVTDGTTKADFSSSTESAEETETRKQMVKFAKKYLGNPYVYGGTSLTNGTDCSGFTMRIYEHFGVKLPRTAAEQYNASKHIDKKDLLPGDLLFYKDKSGGIGHVTMYIGGNKVIHASSSTTGIIISNIDYRTPCGYGRFSLKKSTTKTSNKEKKTIPSKTTKNNNKSTTEEKKKEKK